MPALSTKHPSCWATIGRNAYCVGGAELTPPTMTEVEINKFAIPCGWLMSESCSVQVAALVQLHNDSPTNCSPSGQQHASNGATLTNSDSDLLQILQAYCKSAGLSSFKLPRRILGQTEPLPMNASGKVLKTEVRVLISSAQFGSDTRLWHRSRL